MKQTKLTNFVIANLYRIIYEGAYSSIISKKIIKEEFSSGEKNYVLRLSYGVLENLILLNYYLDELAKKGIKKKIRILLLLALYEIEFMDDNAHHISVNKYVDYAKENYPYAKNFINAILRNHMRKGLARFEPKSFYDYSIYYSHAKEIANILKESYGEEKAIDMMKINQTKSDLILRVNLSKCSRDEMILNLKKEGVKAKISLYSKRCVIIESLNNNSITNLAAYKKGHFYIQDLSSILLIDALNIKGNEKVLDLCSAPGGKALGICEDIKRQDGKGKVIACDVFDEKIKIIKENSDRLGLEIETLINDASVVKNDFIENFDIVLADVPCSGLGIIRKKPEIKYRKLEKNIKSMLKLQEEILYVASRYVKDNGKLVYSTCTTNIEENQNQVEKFLSINKNFVQDSVKTLKIQSKSGLQLLTSKETDGFFIAILKRIG